MFASICTTLFILAALGAGAAMVDAWRTYGRDVVLLRANKISSEPQRYVDWRIIETGAPASDVMAVHPKRLRRSGPQAHALEPGRLAA